MFNCVIGGINDNTRQIFGSGRIQGMDVDCWYEVAKLNRYRTQADSPSRVATLHENRILALLNEVIYHIDHSVFLRLVTPPSTFIRSQGACSVPRFRYCLNASTIATTPILRQIEVAAAAGYAAIELWHDHIDTHLETGGTLAEIRRAIDDSGLKIPTTIYLAGWFQPAGPEHEVALTEVRRRLEQAAAVGAEFSIAGPPPGIADRELGARHYAELLELGRLYGVKPAFEYLGFVDDINSIDDAIDIIQRSGHPDATIVVDPFHCWRGGGSPASIRKLQTHQIAISHFNDAPAVPPAHTQHDSRSSSAG